MSLVWSSQVMPQKEALVFGWSQWIAGTPSSRTAIQRARPAMGMFALVFLGTCALVLSIASAGNWNPDCITAPVGFGRRTSGGKKGKIVTPRNPDELADALCSRPNNRKLGCEDASPRIIVLDKLYDFRRDNITVDGCMYSPCGAERSGFQFALDHARACDGREKLKVSINEAGRMPLLVGSNKSILGKNGAQIVGRGLWLGNSNNIIIRDLTIRNVNPHAVWGGDAIAMSGVHNVWIHKVTFKEVGRQFLVTHQQENTDVTVSSCLFDGQTKTSYSCDGTHHWVWLFRGNNDTITLINNRIVNTSGRAPLAGGWDGANNLVHIINNRFQDITGHAMDPRRGGVLLVEGNHFDNVKAVTEENGGAEFGQLMFLPQNQNESDICKATFGRPCLPNVLVNSAPGGSRLDVAAVTKFALEKEAVNSARNVKCGSVM